jgi:1-acyl-sn-glycerol-3-phosphate acyltransferase
MGLMINNFTSFLRWVGVFLTTVLMCIPSTLCGLLDRTGKIAHAHHRLWARFIMFWVGAKLVVTGRENIDPDKNYIIASNHEGNADIPIMIWALPLQFKFAAKRSLFRIPIFGWAMSQARYVPIDRGIGSAAAREGMKRLTQKAQEGFSILMFPEGTRTRDGKIRPFKSGTFRLALETKTEILPVAIFGSYRGQSAGEWGIRPGRVILNIGKPIKPFSSEVKGGSEENSEDRFQGLKTLCRNQIIALRQEAFALDATLTGSKTLDAPGLEKTPPQKIASR